MSLKQEASDSSQSTASRKQYYDPIEYKLRKRLPASMSKDKNHIYINSKTNFSAQLKRCQKLLDEGEEEVFLHGLGKAVTRAVNIALQIKSVGAGSVDVTVNTSTVDLIDDVIPESNNGEASVQTRKNSAIHIKLFKVNGS
ncbi:POP7 (predicted) [Pycnogonum litorale]